MRVLLAVMLVLTFCTMAGGGVLEDVHSCECSDGCQDSSESCNECDTCKPATHIVLLSFNDKGHPKQLHSWQKPSPLNVVEDTIPDDIDHPPRQIR